VTKAWRIVKAVHAAAAFTGLGAKLAGGRWNSPGATVVYAAGSIALGVLEILVHVGYEEVVERYVAFEVSFDEALVKTLIPAALPRNWRKSPPPVSIQRIGDAWIANRESPILRVPSAVVPTEWNFLLNPNHPDFGQIAIGPKQTLRLDRRLA
jgi:RES domain-containing protein